MTILALLSEGDGFDVFAGASGYIWTLIVFAISLPFMWKVVFGPITRALNDRELKAREAAQAAETARGEVDRMKAAIQEDLEAARREAAQQVADAKARGEVREKEILAAAREQAEADRLRAQAEIERALAAARETLRTESVEIGIQVAQQVLRRELAEADHSRLVEEFRRELNAS